MWRSSSGAIDACRAPQAFHKAVATHPDAPRGPRRGGDRRGRRGRRRGRESLDDRFTRLLEIDELEKQVRRAAPPHVLFHPQRSPAAAPACVSQRWHSSGTVAASDAPRSTRARLVLCTAGAAHSALTPPRVSTHGRPTHAGEPGPWQPVNAHTDDVASSGHGTAREWAAWYRCAFALRGEGLPVSQNSLSHTRVAQSTIGAQRAHATVEVSVSLSPESPIEWAVRPVPFRAGVGSLHLTSTRSRRRLDARGRATCVGSRAVRATRARAAFVTAPFFASGAQRCLRSTTQR